MGCHVAVQVIKLIEAVEELKRQCEIPPTIRECLNNPAAEDQFLQRCEQ